MYCPLVIQVSCIYKIEYHYSLLQFEYSLVYWSFIKYFHSQIEDVLTAKYLLNTSLINAALIAVFPILKHWSAASYS